jgi:hypothetical protein
MIKYVTITGRTPKADLVEIARQCRLSVIKGKTGYNLTPIDNAPDWSRFQELRKHIKGMIFEVLDLSSPLTDYLQSI